MPLRKHSRKRDAILNCVRSTTTHPTADWVYARLKPQVPDLSLGTVYRNLALFKQEGAILSVGVVDGMERFDGNTAPHVHFICTSCGAVIDLPSLSVPIELAQQVDCGHVTECTLSFRGICNSCSESGEETEN